MVEWINSWEAIHYLYAVMAVYAIWFFLKGAVIGGVFALLLNWLDRK
jgi:hypothetical protein